MPVLQILFADFLETQQNEHHATEDILSFLIFNFLSAATAMVCHLLEENLTEALYLQRL
jgi:hypothetical protein